MNIKKIYCNSCKSETNHDVKSSHDKSYYEEYESNGQSFPAYYEETEYYFLVCRGCDTATLEEKSAYSGMYDYNGDTLYFYNYYPKRKKSGVIEAKQFHHVDKKLNDIYKEIVISFQQGLAVVTAMGVRALLEGICVLEGIDDSKAWGLNKKLDRLTELSSIPNAIVDGLKRIKFIGDDAAHRLNTPEKSILVLSINLLESLMTHMYEAKFDLDHKASLLKKTHDSSE